MNDTPASLLEQLRRPGEARAWDRFVRLYTPFLYQCIRPLGLQPADAADLLQDVFLLLLRKLPEFRYDPAQSFRSWLRTLLLNKWRDHQRRRVPMPSGSGADLPGPDPIAEYGEREYRRYVMARALE